MKHDSLEKLASGLTTWLLVIVLLLATAGSLLPLYFPNSWAELETALQAPIVLSPLDLKSVAERLFAFTPLGFLIQQKLIQKGWRNASAKAAILVTLIALMIELLQALISIRHSLLLDFILAAAAGMVGICFRVSIHQMLIQPLSKTLRGLLPGMLALGNYIVVCAFIAAIVPASTELREWDCSYPLLVGDELTHGRPWHGKIRGLAFYPRELTLDEIRRLSQASLTPGNAMLRKTMGALVSYSFAATENKQVLPRGSDSSSMTLIIKEGGLEKQPLEKGALHIRKSTFIKSAGSADFLCNAILTSQAFAIETEIASTDLMQKGPARIISNSINTSHRNFALSEHKGDLVLRVRTPQNGANGSKIALKTGGNVLAGGWHHVVASYADGVAKLFVDNKEAAPPLRYDELFFLGTTLTTRAALAISVLLLAMGFIASVIFYSRMLPKALLLTVFSTSSIPLVFSFSVAFGLDRHLSPAFFGAVLLMPLPGFLLAWEWQRRFVKTF